MNVLILGATGMLGSMVYDYLTRNTSLNAIGTSRKKLNGLVQFDAYSCVDDFQVNGIKLEDIDYLVNCIGITKPYCNDNDMQQVRNAVYINSMFPQILNQSAEKHHFKIIQIATDCVYSGVKGYYTEISSHDPLDVYGKTKSLGEIKSKHFLNVRCSIIGPEKFNKVFLLEWFLNQKDEVTINGFYNHFWNGVTTLQFAKLCERVIIGGRYDGLISESAVHHFVPNDSASKYELLKMFNKVFNRNLTIKRCKGGEHDVNRILATEHKTISSFFANSTIEKELQELRDYIDRTGFYKNSPNVKYVMVTESKDRQLGEYVCRQDCRFCQSKNLVTVLDLGNVPLAGGFLKPEQFEDERFYPLDLSFCRDCTLVQVSNVVSAETLFKNYFYFSSSIKTLVRHFEDFAGEVKEKFLRDVNNPSAFELGCNDGVFLKPLAARGIKAVGVDPATNVVNSVDSKNITIINDFFSEKLAQKIRKKHGPFDAVLSSYSFAHIDDMVSIIKGIKHLMKENGVFIFEVYYLGTLIDEMQYDMIYHEHMSYYSLKALSTFLKRFGMEIFDVKFIPGVRSGAARFYARNIGKRPGGISPAVTKLEQDEKQKGFDKVDTFLSYASKVNGTREELLKVLEHLKKEGKTVIGYGASGRGTTIMNFCGINGRYLDYVVDDAPAKHSFFTPGTHVPIKPWEFTKQSKLPDYVLLFAWSFIDEVKKRRADYLQAGGKFIVPLPTVRIVSQ